jgi:lipopolysaccharide export system protein LptA
MSPRAASLLPAFAFAIVTASIVAATFAGLVHAKSTDRNQPMDLDANESDCSVEENGPCVFTGNVHIVQGSLDIRAAKADVRRGDGDIQRVLLSGSPVQMKQALDSGGSMSARASNVDYDMPKDTVVFTGNVEIDQPGRGTMSGPRIVYNMRTGQVQGGGDGSEGQVHTTILPKNAQRKNAQDEKK